MIKLPTMKMAVGVVEDIMDPAQLGRLRVRYFHIHSPNSNEMPTDKLPWSQVLLPVNHSYHISTPDYGDWVLATFLDGEHAQEPLVIGVIPGINPTDVPIADESDAEIASLEEQLAKLKSTRDSLK